MPALLISLLCLALALILVGLASLIVFFMKKEPPIIELTEEQIDDIKKEGFREGYKQGYNNAIEDAIRIMKE